MKTIKEWISHFTENAKKERVDWNLNPNISQHELSKILESLQAWQLGETSDGSHLIQASSRYAEKIKDYDYIEAVKLFIIEEQKHGNNLGKYLDLIKKPRIAQNWGDTLFRNIRYYNSNMEIWTLAVITVESTAQVFYQSIKDATNCNLLKQICTDILTDEAYHIQFQCERMRIIFSGKPSLLQSVSRYIYPAFFFATALVVWLAHQQAFKSGGVSFNRYCRKMKNKYVKTLGRIVTPATNTRHYTKGRNMQKAETV